MSELERVNSLLRCADLYREQGLYTEAMEKYREALTRVSDPGLPLDEELRESVKERIRLVDEKIAECDEEDELPALTGDLQRVIDLFSFAGSRERAAFEGAFSLMRLGQYRRATEEFEKLLAEGVHPLPAARHIVACLLLAGSPQKAVERFGQWCTRNLLSVEELLQIRDFLKLSLLGKEIAADLPFPPTKSQREGGPAPEPVISMMTLEFEEGLLKGRTEELKVTFQFANLLSSIVSPSRRELIDSLRPGAIHKRMGFYSSDVFFRGRGRVASRSVLHRGPCRGDYLFDISIEVG